MSFALDLFAGLSSTKGLKNYLFNPVNLGVQWLNYFKTPIPAKVSQILKEVDICRSLTNLTSFFPKIEQVLRKGPKLKGLHCDVEFSQTQKVSYKNKAVRSAAFYVGFVSSTLSFIKDLNGRLFELPAMQKVFLRRSIDILNIVTAGLNYWAEGGLREQLKLKEEENILSMGRAAFCLVQIAHGFFRMSPYKTLPLPKLVFLTSLTGLTFFNYLYEKRVVEPLRESSNRWFSEPPLLE